MAISEHAVRLAEVHESPGYRAVRFDSNDPLGGRIAVLPSAFNPPTRAHLGLIELALATGEIGGAAALLSTNNVDKGLFGAPLSHRVGMLLRLKAERPWLAVLACNAARIADQGLALAVAFPEVRFDFVLGFDTLVRLFDPRYYEDMHRTLEEFFARHRVIATNRAQATADAVRDFVAADPNAQRYVPFITVLELDPVRASLSSTLARQQIPHGGTDALTPEVREYILEHGLYGEGEG